MSQSPPGQIARLYLDANPEPVASPAPPAALASPRPTREVDLTSLVGRYWSEELGTAYDVVQRDDGLALRHWRHGEVALRASGADRFRSSTWWVQHVKFVRSAAGEVSGLEVSSPRVWNVSFARISKQLSR